MRRHHSIGWSMLVAGLACSSLSIASGQSILPDSVESGFATRLPSHPMFQPLIDDVYVGCDCQDHGRVCQCTTEAAARQIGCPVATEARLPPAPVAAIDQALRSADQIVARLPIAPEPSNSVTDQLAELLWLSLEGNADNPDAQRKAIRTALEIASRQAPIPGRRQMNESSEIKRLKTELVQVTAQCNALLESNARYQTIFEQFNQQKYNAALRNNLQSMRAAIDQIEHSDARPDNTPLMPLLPVAQQSKLSHPLLPLPMQAGTRVNTPPSQLSPMPPEIQLISPPAILDDIARNPGALGIRPHLDAAVEKTLTSDVSPQPVKRLPLQPMTETPRPEQDTPRLEPVFEPEQIQQLMQKLKRQQQGLELQLRRQQQQIQSNQALLNAMEAIAHPGNR